MALQEALRGIVGGEGFEVAKKAVSEGQKKGPQRVKAGIHQKPGRFGGAREQQKTDLAENTPKMPKAGLESVQVGAARADGWGAAKVLQGCLRQSSGCCRIGAAESDCRA